MIPSHHLVSIIATLALGGLGCAEQPAPSTPSPEPTVAAPTVGELAAPTQAPPPAPTVAFQSRLPALPRSLGPLTLGEPAPSPECVSSEDREDGTRTCFTRDPALRGPLGEALGRSVPAAQLVSRDGRLDGFSVSVAGCDPRGAERGADPLLAKLQLSPASRRSPTARAVVSRQDAAGTSVSLSDDDDDWCTLTLGEAVHRAPSDATSSEGEVEGLAGAELVGADLGGTWEPVDGAVESALLRDDGLVLAVRRGVPTDGALVVQPMTRSEGRWRAQGPAVEVPTPSWGVASAAAPTPPAARLFGIGSSWLIVEFDQTLCHSGADLCHPHRAAALLHRDSKTWSLVGAVPVELTGSYGHPTRELRHFGYDRAVVSVSDDALRLRLTPGWRRALCDANTPGCTVGPVEYLHDAHTVRADLVADATSVTLERPSALDLAREFCAHSTNARDLETVVALLEMPIVPGQDARATPQALAWTVLVDDEQPAPTDERRAHRALARECINGARVDEAVRARLLERLDAVEIN